MSSDANRFRVVRSPYWTIKKGRVGTLIRKEFVGTHAEVWLLDFGPLGTWRFTPSEVVRVD